MPVFAAIAAGLAMGAIFGFVLEKSRVFEPGVIVGQMQLKSFIMLKIFLSAVATGLVVVAILYGTGLSPIHPKALLLGADIVGGLILGVGIALAGACPGTVMAQVGVGYRDAPVTLGGGLLGALAFVYAEPVLRPILLTGGPGKLTLDVVTGLPFWALALGLAVMLVLGLAALERWRPWRGEIGPNGDGLTNLPARSDAPLGRAAPAR